MLRLVPVALLGGMLLIAPAAVRAQATAPADTTPAPATPAAPAPAPPAVVDGFRSAHFGMAETEVRKAIDADFKQSGSAVKVSSNSVERTRALSVTVPDLVPDSGKAVIDYVLGYKTQRLIRVNVTWTTAGDSGNKPDTLVHTGLQLQEYFQSEAFPPGKAVANMVAANGAAVVFFRGTDAAGHLVDLVLTGPVHQDTKEHKAQMTPATLSLVYAADPEHPDVFRLQKGLF